MSICTAGPVDLQAVAAVDDRPRRELPRLTEVHDHGQQQPLVLGQLLGRHAQHVGLAVGEFRVVLEIDVGPDEVGRVAVLRAADPFLLALLFAQAHAQVDVFPGWGAGEVVLVGVAFKGWPGLPAAGAAGQVADLHEPGGRGGAAIEQRHELDG